MEEKQWLALQEEIASLPRGYLSKKVISGKTRYYLQWSENGKKRSRYVDEETAKKLRDQIQRRRELQQKEKELRPVGKKKSSDPFSFQTNVLTGEMLKKYASGVAHYKKRDLYRDLESFVYGDIQDRILILYGLRRTGKTTLIRQLIGSMDEESLLKTALFQIKTGDGLAEVHHDLKYLLKEGYQYVFVDEATRMKDFIDGAALFSDVYAGCGMKIVLSGTDSLGFFFSQDEQLYDRCFFLHTTFIPYREFEEVLGIRGVDEYICYGGTMSLSGIRYNEQSPFANSKNADEYVDAAIAKNVQHSLEFYQNGGHFRALYDLFEKGELTSVINRVVEESNHRFTLDVLTRDFVSHDLGISANNLRKDRRNPNDILDRMDKKSFTERLRKQLEIRNKSEQTITISEEHRKEIKEYLDALDFTRDIEVRTLPGGGKVPPKTVLTQPGIRYAQAKEFVKSLLLDEEFQTLSAEERNAVVERILSEIKGRMMEEMALLETKLAHPNQQVFQLQFAVGEFDMVVTDEASATCQIYEIKHSREQAKDQYRHLVDEEKLKATEFRYGKITKRVVLYRGDSCLLENGIAYQNVEEYLKKLPAIPVC